MYSYRYYNVLLFYFYTEQSSVPLPEEISSINESDQLLFYFQWLSKQTTVKDIDFAYISHLLESNADIKARDS